MDNTLYVFTGITVLAVAYLFVMFVFDVILRGFAPIIPSRPWVVEQIINSIKLKRYRTVYAFSCGRSGFLRQFAKMFPEAEITGIEYSFFHYLVAHVQLALRRIFGSSLRMKIIMGTPRSVDVRNAEIVYSHLYPEHMEGLGRKLKFDCMPGTLVISAGFLIPDLEAYHYVEFEDKKGRLAWLSRNRELFKSKRKKSRKENRAYFYEI